MSVVDSIQGPQPLSASDTMPSRSVPIAWQLTRPEMNITIDRPVIEPARWQTGEEGILRPISIGDNSGVLLIIAVITLLMMGGFRHAQRMFGQLANGLWDLRPRANAFDEHTSGETRMLVLMAVQFCVYLGLLLYSAMSYMLPEGELPPSQALTGCSALMGLAAVYYIFQLAAYNVVGYVFTTPQRQRLFVQGFTSSQALLGFALIVPALVSIFYPTYALEAICVAIVCYVLARLAFIIKGIRIFYENFGSLLYFILYLCTLEILPVIFVVVSARWLITII